MYHANWRLWRQGHEPPFSQRTHDSLLRAYDDSIRYADDFLKQLLADLAEDDPVIAVHGDHGEAFGEHGTYGHHARLYEENIHVPFVVTGGPTDTIENPVSLRDIPNLLAEFTSDGLTTASRGPVDSRTLDGQRISARGRHWKYLRNGESEEELYSLSDGGVERAPLENAGLLEAARSITDRWLEDRAERERISRAVEDGLGAAL